MARLVIPKSDTNGHFADAGAKDRPPDSYSDRLVKYLPAESVAFYAAIDMLVASHYGIDSSALAVSNAPTAALICATIFFVAASSERPSIFIVVDCLASHGS